LSPIYTSSITVSSTTTIKAEAWKTGMNPSTIATATYTIYTPVLTSITVSPSTATLARGSTLTFTAQPKDQFGNPVSATITWNSSNTAVGTITQNGLFTALSAGSTTITASNGSVSGTASVTVKRHR
jgi:uncharacterized protein YjdB